MMVHKKNFTVQVKEVKVLLLDSLWVQLIGIKKVVNKKVHLSQDTFLTDKVSD